MGREGWEGKGREGVGGGGGRGGEGEGWVITQLHVARETNS